MRGLYMSKQEIDCHGRDVVGLDEDGGWWGTDNAWWILGDPDTSGCDENGVPDGSEDGPEHDPATPHLFIASGVGYEGQQWDFAVVASSEARLQEFAASLGVKRLEGIETHKLRRGRYHVGKTVYLTDSQAAKRLGRHAL